MTEQPETTDGQPTPGAPDAPAPAPASPEHATSWAPPDATAEPPGAASSAVADRPEIAVGASFAGGFLLALILKRLAG